MVKLKGWTFKDHCKFLESYGFKLGHVTGSHFFYYGSIKGKQRVVQAINNSYEKKCQSMKTMNFSIKHSGIDKKYYIEWKLNKVIHHEIIK